MDKVVSKVCSYLYFVCHKRRPQANLEALTAVLMLTTFLPVGYQYTIVNRPREIVELFVNHTMHERGRALETDQDLDMFYSFLVACQGIGAVLGAAFGPYLADHIGRKWTAMGVLGACQVLGSVCLMFAFHARSFELIIVGRLLVGTSTGLTFAIVPMYLLECAPASYRGSVGSLCWLAVLVGDTIARFVNFAANENTWSYCFGATICTGLALLMASAYFHESPKYLLMIRQDYDAGMNALSFYFSEPRVLSRLAKIAKEEQTNTEPPVSFRRILKHDIYRTPLLLSIVINISTAAGGLYAVFSYSTKIFDGLQGLQKNPYFDVARGQIMIPVNILSGLIQLFLVTRVKSRPLILFSIGGVIVFNSIFFIAAIIDHHVDNSLAATYLAAVSLGLAVIAMNLGCAPMSLYLPAEISVTAARPRTATAGAVTKMLGFLVTQLVFLIMYDSIRDYVFLVFIALCTLCLMYLAKYLPETKGQSLDDITKNWRKHDNRVVQTESFPFEALAAIEQQRKLTTVQSPSQDLFEDWY